MSSRFGVVNPRDGGGSHQQWERDRAHGLRPYLHYGERFCEGCHTYKRVDKRKVKAHKSWRCDDCRGASRG